MKGHLFKTFKLFFYVSKEKDDHFFVCFLSDAIGLRFSSCMMAAWQGWEG